MFAKPHCPQCHSATSRLAIGATGTAHCTRCGAKFLLSDRLGRPATLAAAFILLTLVGAFSSSFALAQRGGNPADEVCSSNPPISHLPK